MRLLSISLCGLCAIALGACANTLQDQPIAHNVLEGLVSAPFPVYWLGGRFEGFNVSEASHDPSGSFSVQYGDCLEGGQGVCVPPIRVVTSPDNSFLPGGAGASAATAIRGIAARESQRGRTLVIPTGQVVVDIYAASARLARAAAQTIVPIDAVGSPQAPLPPRLPDSGFGEQPLPSQVPSPLHPLG